MVKKRLMAGALAVLMCFSITPFMQPTPVVFARESNVSSMNRFHYEQLDETAKSIYDGIYQMYEKDLLKTGNEDYDLAENGQFSQTECEALSKDTKKLTDAMNAARYAFYADYPEVFYVNFPKLNVRPTKDSDGVYHIYVGSGRYESYYLDGFTSESQVDGAIAAFDARVDEIVDGAKNVKVPEGKNAQVEQIRYVHNEIINHVSYRLEDTCFEGDSHSDSNASYLGTPYGALVKKQSVCEGYARAFKSVMDELGINSILVQGVHQYDSEVAVAHMWNYVEIDNTDAESRSLGGKWYAMDLTQDDPEDYIIPEKELVDYTQNFEEYGKDGFENEKYFLAGQLTLNGRHFIDETIDAAGGYTFTYPSIEDVDYGVRDATNTMDGFLVKQKTVTGNHGLDVTEYQISYKGMNATDARKQGIYLLARYYDEDENGNIVPLTGWCYFSDAYAFKEDDTSIYLQEGEVMYMEFAATTVVPRPGLEGFTYAGDDFGLIAKTGKIYNENQNDYQAPPFIKRATPSQTATIFPGKSKYHIMIEYDETLMLEDGVSEDDLSIMIKCSSNLGNEVTGAEYSKISNITWDGDKVVEFDVQFSQMFADDNVNYNFYPQGLIGSESKKAPNPACYGVANMVECPCVQNRRGSWELYAKPTLLEDMDLSVQDWTLSNGKAVSDKLTNRIALVATKTSEKQVNQIQDILNQDMPEANEQILDSSTFNITLSVCKLNVVKTGHKLKVKVGFPTGYGPEDEGVTFKAYHFKRDAQGNVTGVEEIDCVVTPYGLIITCDSFSPFMVAAVSKDESASSEKSVVVTTSDGGTITGDVLDESKVLKLGVDTAAVLKVQPEDGFEIESVTVCGENVDVSDVDGVDIPVTYDEVGVNNIVHANFVAKAVVEKEAERDEVPVVVDVEPVDVTLPEKLTVDTKLDIIPEISEKPGVHTYQWYKDGELLLGETSAELHLENVSASVAGKYQLKVVTTLDTVSAETMSNECKVVVSQGCEHANTTTHDAVESTCVKQGNAEYVTCDDCDVVVSGSDAKLPLADHRLVEKADAKFLKSEATCAKKALYFKSCSVCGAASTETFEHGEKLEHQNTVIRNENAATCLNGGYTGDTFCTDCGTVVEQGSVIPAIGHALEETPAKDATHEAAGNIAYFTCSVCDKLFADALGKTEISVEDTVVPKQEHEYVYEFEGDGHWGTCSCGDVTEKVTHDMGEWVVTRPATEFDDGVKERGCSVCDYAEALVIPKGDHVFSEYYVYDAESHWRECSCGNVVEKELHTFDEWIVTKEATETEAGSQERTCSVCGYKEVQEIPAKGHIYPDIYEFDAENHWKECACGDVVEKEAHTFDEWVVTKEASHTEAGSRERVCTVCGYKETQELDKVKHDYITKYDEKDHWSECSCGDVIGKAAHELGEWTVTKEATDSETGLRERHCTGCDYVETEEIPVIGHEHAYGEEYQSDKENHWKACECGDVVEKESHTFDEWVVTKEATKTEAGSQERACQVCGYKDVQEIPIVDKDDDTDEPDDKTDVDEDDKKDDVSQKPSQDDNKPSDNTDNIDKTDDTDTKNPDKKPSKPNSSNSNDNNTNDSGQNNAGNHRVESGGKSDGSESVRQNIQTGDTGVVLVFGGMSVLLIAGLGFWIWKRKSVC